MKILPRLTLPTLLGLAVSLAPGCSKKGVDPKVIEGAAKLPGASNVMAAIEKKDYDGAMAALMNVQKTITTPEQDVEFRVLARQARDKLNETAATDPKAAEAVAALRAMTTGGR